LPRIYFFLKPLYGDNGSHRPFYDENSPIPAREAHHDAVSGVDFTRLLYQFAPSTGSLKKQPDYLIPGWHFSILNFNALYLSNKKCQENFSQGFSIL